MRHPLVIGNWKLHGSRNMVNEIITSLRKKLLGVSGCSIAIAPPEIYIELAKRISDNSQIEICAQNVDINLSGAFTGETSAIMLKDIGVRYVIIGHSDRRIHHKECDEIIAKKFSVLKEQDLIPILCIGETEEENLSGKTEEVCAHQIDTILKRYGPLAFKNTVIAYEPIWAIGRGKSANPKKVQKIHKFIRDHISKNNKKISEQIIIQYGGSVNSDNAEELFCQPDIDGALVGSASLKAETFSTIVKMAETAKYGASYYCRSK